MHLRGALAGPETPERQNSFKFRIIGKVEASGAGTTIKMETEAAAGYTWKVKGSERTLICDSTHLKVSTNGKEEMDFTADRNRFKFVQGDKHEDVDFDHAPQRTRDMLRSCYELPLCKLTVDENGRETGREVLATGAAKVILADKGAITNATFFHPPFFADKKEWTAPAMLSIGGANVVQGDLTYARIADEKGLATFKVTGTLTNDGFTEPGSKFTEKGMRHVITGKHSYDPLLHEWVAGSLTIATSSQTFSNGQQVGGMQGTMEAEFERLDGKPVIKP